MKKSLIFLFVMLLSSYGVSASLSVLKNFCGNNKPLFAFCGTGVVVYAARYFTSKKLFKIKTHSECNKILGREIEQKRYNLASGRQNAKHIKKILNLENSTEFEKIIKDKKFKSGIIDECFDKYFASDKDDRGYVSRFKGGVIFGLLAAYVLKANKKGTFLIYPSDILNF